MEGGVGGGAAFFKLDFIGVFLGSGKGGLGESAFSSIGSGTA